MADLRSLAVTVSILSLSRFPFSSTRLAPTPAPSDRRRPVRPEAREHRPTTASRPENSTPAASRARYSRPQTRWWSASCGRHRRRIAGPRRQGGGCGMGRTCCQTTARFCARTGGVAPPDLPGTHCRKRNKVKVYPAWPGGYGCASHAQVRTIRKRHILPTVRRQGASAGHRRGGIGRASFANTAENLCQTQRRWPVRTMQLAAHQKGTDPFPLDRGENRVQQAVLGGLAPKPDDEGDVTPVEQALRTPASPIERNTQVRPHLAFLLRREGHRGRSQERCASRARAVAGDRVYPRCHKIRTPVHVAAQETLK
jgi:hypothetical protein